MTNSKRVIPDILTPARLEGLQQRQRDLETSGYWPRFKLSLFLNRSRPTINQWDKLLLSFIPDYAEYWPGENKPLTDYQRWCLQKLSKYQNKQEPYKPVADLVSYIERNVLSFTMTEYIKQFRG